MNRESKRRARHLLGYLLGGLILVTGTLLLTKSPSFRLDANAVLHGARQTKPPPEELLAALQEDVDESTFRVVLNTRPVFESPDAAGDLLLQNSAENAADMRVTITLDDTGETVYQSAVLSPGTGELYGKLLRPLPAGSYPATATATALGSDTGDALGTVTSKLTITVQ